LSEADQNLKVAQEALQASERRLTQIQEPWQDLLKF
jgi:FtsZ-binding cell division protein ZapB